MAASVSSRARQVFIKRPWEKCLLYEARKTVKSQKEDERKLVSRLNEVNPKMALVQVMSMSADEFIYK